MGDTLGILNLFSRNAGPILVGLGALAAFTWLWFHAAWFGDDAYASYRAAENVAAGNGPSWDPRLRVQAYSNPAWVLLMAAFRWLHSDIRVVSLVLSYVCSVAALILAARSVGDIKGWGYLLGFALLTSSRSFVDFTSSGLESPLTLMIVASLCAVTWAKPGLIQRTTLVGIVSLGLVNRLDMLWLCAPLLVWVGLRSNRRDLPWLALAMLPIFCWLVFALVYFGTPLPNTYFAKLPPSIAKVDMWVFGLRYLWITARFDPVGASLVLLGIVSPWMGRHDEGERVWSISLFAGLAYIIFVGGDFMVGRFVAPLTVGGAVIVVRSLASSGAPRPRIAAGLLAFSALCHLVVPQLPWTYRSGQGTAFNVALLVTDERGFRPNNQLLVAMSYFGHLEHATVFPAASPEEPLEVVVVRGCQPGYDFPSTRWALGVHGLTDPLLARLLPERSYYVPGHLTREVPEGYPETLSTGEMAIVDPRLAAYAERIFTVCQGPIWTRERWAQIWHLNVRERFYAGGQ